MRYIKNRLKETPVKKYLVELTHARILLKADQGPQGPGWGDSRIMALYC